MNELIPTIQNEQGEIILSGRELHDFLEVGTRYDTWINRMIEYGFVEGSDYVEVIEKVDAQKRARTYDQMDHHLKLDMAKEIAMVQRSEKGKQARLYFLYLEKLWNSPEMVMKRALDYASKRINELETKQKQDEPFTTFGKVVSNSTASINIGAFAKMIYDKHGIKLGRNKMFEWLREKGYLIRHGRERNNPKQQYIEQGLFDTTITMVSRTVGDVESLTTLITGKGQVKLTEHLLKDFKGATT